VPIWHQLILVGTKNANNSTILINSVDFLKKMEKNTLTQWVEAKNRAKKGANHRDFL